MNGLARLAAWLLALVLAAAAHLAAFQLFPQREETVLQAGGRVQLQLGLDQVAVRRGPEPTDSLEDRQAEPETPAAPDPAPELTPEPELVSPVEDASIPDPESKPQPAPEPDLQPAPEPEPEPEPEADPASAPEPYTAETPEDEDARQDEADRPADAETGPEQDEAGSQARQGDDDVEDDAAQAGNAASENYAGEVLRHLSQMRRPRASGPGTARVAFTIALDGSLERVDIVESSRSRRFDREAVRMIERAAPFPQPPAGVNRDFTIEIEGR